jgi:hypothetical protein
MPLRPDPFLARFERLRDLRRKPWIGYGVTAVAIAASIGARMAVGDLLAAAPFLTFYPAAGEIFYSGFVFCKSIMIVFYDTV